MSAEVVLPPKCPKDGAVLKESGVVGRFLVCPKCEYAFDSWLSREAVRDEWDVATWFLRFRPNVTWRVRVRL